MNQSVNRFKAEFFKALAHPMRLAILQHIRSGEKSVNELHAALGIDQSAVSQQLAILRNRNIVDSRKDGTTVYYSARDPLIFQLLDVAGDIFNNHLISTQELLEQITKEAEPT